MQEPEFQLLQVPGCPTAYRVPVLADAPRGGARRRGGQRRGGEHSGADGLRTTSAAFVPGAAAVGDAGYQDEPPCSAGGSLSAVAARLRGNAAAPPRIAVGRLMFREGAEEPEPTVRALPGVVDVVVDRTSALGNPFPMGAPAADVHGRAHTAATTLPPFPPISPPAQGPPPHPLCCASVFCYGVSRYGPRLQYPGLCVCARGRARTRACVRACVCVCVCVCRRG